MWAWQAGDSTRHLSTSALGLRAGKFVCMALKSGVFFLKFDGSSGNKCCWFLKPNEVIYLLVAGS